VSELGRRRLLQIAGASVVSGAIFLGGSGLLTTRAEYEGDDRIYTCSYDATEFGLEDTGQTVSEAWTQTGSAGQTRDIMPDRAGNLLTADDNGLHKWRQTQRGLDHEWVYEAISGSIRGITVDRDNDYYIGSWTADQGFHKVVEADDDPKQAWVYRWDDDTGMITAAADPEKRIALALKNGSVHLIREHNGEPAVVWQWDSGSDEIVREVLWDHSGALYVASEDHTLYKLRETDSGEPTVVWRYDAGNMIFGASVTPDGSIYLAVNDGTVHCLRAVGGEPQQQWVYQQTSYEGTAPDDEYFWDGLVHQVAARPDPDSTAVYSCAYGENTTHKIEVVDGEPRQVWEHAGHTDNVREVRIHNEQFGTTPDSWP